MVPFNKPAVIDKELLYLQDAIARGQLAGDGHYTKKCNDVLAQMTGSEAALLTHSCTAALEMAALLCNLEPGDEVIMPSFTFVSTANAVALRGAVPVFVDIDPVTLNIDPARAAAAVTERTRAIFAVHYAGFPADMDALATIARDHNLMLVEDAAQALGSTYKGRPCGSLGHMATFSFHETKNVISGEGGALTLNHPDLIDRAEIMRDKGTNRSRFMRGQVDKYTWVDIGSSFLPGELVASYLYGQLEHVDLITQRRTMLFNYYYKAFEDLAHSGRVSLPQWADYAVGNGHIFYLRLHGPKDRNAFIEHMRSQGIMTPFHYVPLHTSPAGRRLGRFDAPLSVTDAVSGSLVRLPIYFGLGRDVRKVIDAAYSYLENRLQVAI